MQIAPADAQIFSCLQFIATMLRQGGFNQIALKGAQGIMERAGGQFVGGAEALKFGRQILDRQLLAAISKYYAALNHVLKLAYIPWPRVPGESVQVSRGHASLLLFV